MELRPFYNCHSTDDGVESTDPVTLDKDAAINKARQTLRAPRDFIGFIDESENTIQFYYEKSGDIWVELPIPSESDSYGKFISLSEVALVIKSLNEVKCSR